MAGFGTLRENFMADGFMFGDRVGDLFQKFCQCDFKRLFFGVVVGAARDVKVYGLRQRRTNGRKNVQLQMLKFGDLSKQAEKFRRKRAAVEKISPPDSNCQPGNPCGGAGGLNVNALYQAILTANAVFRSVTRM